MRLQSLYRGGLEHDCALRFDRARSTCLPLLDNRSPLERTPVRFSQFGLEAAFALRAVRTAARFVRHIQKHMVVASMAKQDASPVTVADFASQAVVAAMLDQTFPDDPLVAEEGSQVLKEAHGEAALRSVVDFVAELRPDADEARVCRWIDRGMGAPRDRFWVLDPIDGTKGFLRGNQYAAAVALIQSGQIVVGALGCPGLNGPLTAQGENGRAYLAVRDQGAWASDLGYGDLSMVRVSDRGDPQLARILRSFEAAHTDENMLDGLVEALGCIEPPTRMDSQAKYAIVAEGGADLIFRLLSPARPSYREKIWDQAAGSILVEEAGGRVTDLEGKPLDFMAGRELVNNVGVLVSNGLLHEAALRALEAVGAVNGPRTT
jgi:3'(2'), 5'-bisphosphate nucleotidase